MKKALDEAALHAPAWKLIELLKQHPSNGLDAIKRYLQIKLPSIFPELKGWVIEDCVLKTKIEKYGNSDCVREYVIVRFGNPMENLSDIRKIKIGYGMIQYKWVSRDRTETEYRPDEKYFNFHNTSESWGIADHVHRVLLLRYSEPVWTTQQSIFAFLICWHRKRANTDDAFGKVPRDVILIIANHVWASREDRGLWWPSVKPEEYELS
jgi:hypothetical protein